MIDVNKRRLLLTVTAVLAALAIIASGWLTMIVLSPPSWEAGACWGGYVTSVFDKYKSSLIDMYMQESRPYNAVYVEIVPGSHSGYEENKLLHLEFDVSLELDTGETIIQKVEYIGKKHWIEAYEWELK